MTERLTDIELESIHLHETKPRSLAPDLGKDNITQEDDIETACGPVRVMVQGDRSKQAIFTYHDIGLNSISNFQGFFNFSDMQPILKHFCVYHITAPGQQLNAPTLPAGYTYPTMDQLAEMLLPVMQFYSVKNIIGFGMGAGANVLSRFALNHPDKVNGLVLINGCAGKSTWTEWGYQKANCWYLKSGQMTQGIQEYLLWHWFGSGLKRRLMIEHSRAELERRLKGYRNVDRYQAEQVMRENHDLVSVFAENISTINPQNLAFFIDSYIRRDDLGIERCMDHTRKDIVNFKCPVMLVAGAYSPHLEETVKMNGRLDPSESTWIKYECGGMVMEEVPQKLTESFRLFLQGMGYIPGYRPVTSHVSTASSNAMLMNNNKEKPKPKQSPPPAAEAAATGGGDSAAAAMC